tara:strand:- start:1905 stop:2789 length:885 start_codon:yes stop_codon:yes gene_type:complete
MPKYTQEGYSFPSSIDEVGIDIGLTRLPGEGAEDYRRRLLLHIRNPPNPKKDSIITTPQRKVGVFDKEVMIAELVVDADGRPVAKDPRIEIDASFLKVWDDWNYGANEPVLTCNLSLRDKQYFLRDVYSQLSTLTFLTVTKSKLFDDYLKSFNLKISNTDRVLPLQPLTSSRLNKLDLENLRKVMLSNSIVYRNEVASLDLMLQDGDYYIDYDFGYIYSHNTGGGSIHAEYSRFPFIFYWQPVKVFEVNDSSTDQFTKDLLLNDNGVWERLLLNPYGAKIANIILEENPLQWGK